MKELTAFNRKRSVVSGALPVSIKALATFNKTNRGVNAVFCRYKGVNGV